MCINSVEKCAGDMQLLPCMPVAPFKRPQVLMVSATMTDSALQVAEGWLSPNAKRVHVSHAGSDLISSSIIQVCMHACMYPEYSSGSIMLCPAIQELRMTS